jgi:hypothetical protein
MAATDWAAVVDDSPISAKVKEKLTADKMTNIDVVDMSDDLIVANERHE